MPQPLASEEEDTHKEDHMEVHDNNEANLFTKFDPMWSHQVLKTP